MDVKELCAFYEREISDAKENDILLSLVGSLTGLLHNFGRSGLNLTCPLIFIIKRSTLRQP